MHIFPDSCIFTLILQDVAIILPESFKIRNFLQEGRKETKTERERKRDRNIFHDGDRLRSKKSQKNIFLSRKFCQVTHLQDIKSFVGQ